MDVHFQGSFYASHAVYPIMREQNFGRIIFTTSSGGLCGNFGQANYGAAKMGMIGLMNCLLTTSAASSARSTCTCISRGGSAWLWSSGFSWSRSNGSSAWFWSSTCGSSASYFSTSSSGTYFTSRSSSFTFNTSTFWTHGTRSFVPSSHFSNSIKICLRHYFWIAEQLHRSRPAPIGVRAQK